MLALSKCFDFEISIHYDLDQPRTNFRYSDFAMNAQSTRLLNAFASTFKCIIQIKIGNNEYSVIV